MTALSGPGRDHLRQRLFSSVNIACQIEDLPLTRDQIGDIADYLLPVVEAHTRAARADELEQAATDLVNHGWFQVPVHTLLRYRAQALRTHEGDTDGQ